MNRRIWLKSAATLLSVASFPGIVASDESEVSSIEVTANSIDRLADAASKVERLHAIVVMQRGEVVFAEAFRGPPVAQAVNVKSVSKSVVASLVGCALERGVLDVGRPVMTGCAMHCSNPSRLSQVAGCCIRLRAGMYWVHCCLR